MRPPDGKWQHHSLRVLKKKSRKKKNCSLPHYMKILPFFGKFPSSGRPPTSAHTMQSSWSPAKRHFAIFIRLTNKVTYSLTFLASVGSAVEGPKWWGSRRSSCRRAWLSPRRRPSHRRSTARSRAEEEKMSGSKREKILRKKKEKKKIFLVSGPPCSRMTPVIQARRTFKPLQLYPVIEEWQIFVPIPKFGRINQMQ